MFPHTKLTTAALLSAALAHPAAAQEAEPVELEPVIVTATRFETDAASVPASISVAGQESIQSSAATNVADILQDMGVDFRSYTGNPAQSVIDTRGFGEMGNLNVLVLVDGRRINQPDMSSVNWLGLPLAGIDRIEFIRGSQSAMYGNNSAGGVIKISTSIPETTGAVATAGYGSWDSRVFRASGWTSVSASTRVKAEIGYTDSDGWRDNSGYRSRLASTTAEGKIGKLDWTLGAGIDASTFQYPGSIDKATYLSDPTKSGYYYDEKDYRGKGNGGHAEGSLGWKGSDSEMRTDMSYNRRDLWWNLGKWTCAENTLETWSAAPRFKTSLADCLTLVTGIDGEFDRLFTLRFGDVDHSYKLGYARLERSFGAAYSSLSWKSEGERPLTLDLAGRYQLAKLSAGIHDNTADDNFSRTGDDSAVSLGSTWLVAKDVRLWLRGDRFFRYPATDEVAAYSGYPMATPFNKDLRSERGYGMETGAEWFLKHYSFSATFFAQNVEDLIAYDFMQNLNVNTADAQRLGTELSAQAHFGSFRTGVSYTYLDVTYTSESYDGKDLYLVPHNQLSGFAEYAPGRLSARVSVRYTGSQRQGGDSYGSMSRMPSYSVMDIVIRYRIATNLHIYAAVDNALDRKYASLVYYDSYYPAAERGYRAGVQWQY